MFSYRAFGVVSAMQPSLGLYIVICQTDCRCDFHWLGQSAETIKLCSSGDAGVLLFWARHRRASSLPLSASSGGVMTATGPIRLSGWRWGMRLRRSAIVTNASGSSRRRFPAVIRSVVSMVAFSAPASRSASASGSKRAHVSHEPQIGRPIKRAKIRNPIIIKAPTNIVAAYA
jgi:hypothetical protein